MPIRINQQKGKGLSAFVVELKNNEGISTTDLGKMGSFSSPTGEVFFNNAKVPKENILGQPGDGAKIVFSSLNQTRLSAAAGGVGTAQACLDIAAKYCNERVQFGQPIGKFQLNQDMIAQMVTDVEASRLMVYRAAWQKDQGNLNNGMEVAQGKTDSRGNSHEVCEFCHENYGRVWLFGRIPSGSLLP